MAAPQLCSSLIIYSSIAPTSDCYLCELACLAFVNSPFGDSLLNFKDESRSK